MRTEEYPSRKKCLSILAKAGCSKNVIKHCLAVEDLALKIAHLTQCDLELVSCGALLHDIGRGKTHGVKHVFWGGMVAREYGIPEDIINIIEKHIGAGISKEEAKELGLPERDFIPITVEEKIVAHADNLTEEGNKVPLSKVVQRFRDMGYPEIADKIKKLHNELSQLCNIDLDLI